MKKMHAVLFIFLAFSIPRAVDAAESLVINEIMYDAPSTDAKHEWVELYNPGSSPVTIVGGSGTGTWRFNDGSNHVLNSPPAQGSFSVAPGGYAILADDAATFLSDHPGFSGTVIDTTISMANAGSTIKLLDGNGAVVDSVSYTSGQGASGDGNTLQRASTGTWIAAMPTPGTVTASVSDTAGGQASDTSDTTTDTTTSTTETKTETGDTTTTSDTTETTTTTTATSTTLHGGLEAVSSASRPVVLPKAPRMAATIFSPSSAIAGIPVDIGVSILGYYGEVRQAGVFHLAFGDGMTHDGSIPETFSHAYKHPGTYIVTFSYRSGSYMTRPEITVTRTITVTAPTIEVLGMLDGSLQITNTSRSDIDLSGWSIASFSNRAANAFSIPNGTILAPDAPVIIDRAITGFSGSDVSAVGLLLPSGTIAAAYEKNPEHLVGTESPQGVASFTATTANAQPIHSQPPAEFSAAAIKATTSGKNTSESPIIAWLIGIAGLLTALIIILRSFHVFRRPAPDGAVAATSLETQEIADGIRIIEETEPDV